MKIEFQLAGLTFRYAQDPEIATLRPVGVVEIKPEPENKFDANALAVWWQGHQLGFVPGTGPRSKFPEVQPQIHKLLADSKDFTVAVDSYCYRDEGGFNNDHRGKLGAVTLVLSTDGDANIFEQDGKVYGRISQFVDCFKPDGIDFLMRWGINKFPNYAAYEKWMKRAADKGTEMHAAIEAFFCEEGEVWSTLPNNFKAFTSQHEIEPISFEERLYDDNTMLSGQYDMYAVVDGVPTVVDWKSSKAVRLSHKIQVSWYAANKAKEVGVDVQGMVVAFGASTPEVVTLAMAQVHFGYGVVESLRTATDLVKEL